MICKSREKGKCFDNRISWVQRLAKRQIITIMSTETTSTISSVTTTTPKKALEITVPALIPGTHNLDSYLDSIYNPFYYRFNYIHIIYLIRETSGMVEGWKEIIWGSAHI